LAPFVEEAQLSKDVLHSIVSAFLEVFAPKRDEHALLPVAKSAPSRTGGQKYQKRSEVEQEKALEIAAAQHKKELDDLLASQIEETREMERQFQEAQALLHEQVQLLEERHSELQALYDNRPSRDEDLDRIKVLEREVDEKTQQLQTMATTLQKFKLELVNREQNYNKVFGSTPNVGVMDPTAKRGGKQSNSQASLAKGQSNPGLPSLAGSRR